MSSIYTKQYAFDIMVKHLATQNKRSINTEDEQCLYRSPCGARCVIGALIPNNKYCPAMDDNKALNLNMAVINALKDVGYNMSHSMIDFLDRMQAIHDDNEYYVGNKHVIANLVHITHLFDLNQDPIAFLRQGISTC